MVGASSYGWSSRDRRCGRQQRRAGSRPRPRASGHCAGARRHSPSRPRWRASTTARAGLRGARGVARRSSRSGSAQHVVRRLGPRLIAGVTGVPHQTVWRVLKRAGRSRRPKAPREAANRYEWPCPGDLLHMDTKRYARFTRPGHAVTGDRTSTAAEKREQVGSEYAHAIIDDHTRVAYSELHPDERADTVVAFTRRALAWYAGHGVTAKRVMTDNAWTYTELAALQSAARRGGSRAPHDHAPQTADERQDRALPSDHGPRMGLRPRLRLKRPPRPGPTTLAQPLQRATPPQRTRQPATNEPRTQPLEAGQLGSRAVTP